MNNVKLVRLKNGDDIIGDITYHTDDAFIIYDPMLIEIDYRNKFTGLMMKHWLPFQIIKKNQATLQIRDTLFMIDPSDVLCEYYLSSVERIREIANAKEMMDDLDDEDYEEVLEAFEELEQGENVIH